VTFGEQSAGHARRAAPRQCDFLPERELRQAREAIDLRRCASAPRNTGQNRNLHQVHQIEVAEKPQAGQARRPADEKPAHVSRVALQQRLTARHFLENFFREVFSFQQQADMRFLKGRIVEKREEHIGRGMMQRERQVLRQWR